VTVEISATPFEPWSTLQNYENRHPEFRGKAGAAATFVGTMRDFNEGDDVSGMSLEHYPGMTEKHLQKICEKAAEQWSLLDTLIVHRVGNLSPADPIVLVAAWSAHRKDAFEACRFIMEDLKAKAPFWKKEQLQSGSRWVEKNTSGY